MPVEREVKIKLALCSLSLLLTFSIIAYDKGGWPDSRLVYIFVLGIIGVLNMIYFTSKMKNTLVRNLLFWILIGIGVSISYFDFWRFIDIVLLLSLIVTALLVLNVIVFLTIKHHHKQRME